MSGFSDIRRTGVWAAALGLLAACSSSSSADKFPPPSPALWEVTSGNATTEGWLFGTIHELPDGVLWRTEALDNALERSDWLMVEIADLGDTGKLSRIFAELAMSPNHPPLIERVDEEYRADLKKLMTKGSYSKGDFTRFETWAAALTLAQVISESEAENGVDRALISEFAARIELEGARDQLTIFDSLPEKEQRDLLENIVRESRKAPGEEAHKLAKIWLSGNIDKLLESDTDTILSDPELRMALLTNRNTAWISKITAEMEAKGPLMVAVGAAHMVGDDGLPALLEAHGYTVSRIQ